MPLSEKYQILIEALTEYVSEIMLFRTIDSGPGNKAAYDGHLAVAAYLFTLALRGDRFRFLTWVDQEKKSWENCPLAGLQAIKAKKTWKQFYKKTREWRKKYGRLGNSSANKPKKNNRGYIGNSWPLIKRRGSTGEEK
jgi:hypothetical protein